MKAIVNYSVDELLDADVINVYTDKEGNRFVHFLGYAYWSDSGYHILEFVGNEVDLATYLKEKKEMTSDEFNEFYNNGHHCYIGDNTEDEVREYYEDLEVVSDINEQTYDGTYAVLYAA